MAVIWQAPESEDVSDSRIVVSVCLIVVLIAIFVILMWMKNRIRYPPVVPATRAPRQARRRKGIDSHLLESMPVVTYRTLFESNKQNLNGSTLLMACQGRGATTYATAGSVSCEPKAAVTSWTEDVGDVTEAQKLRKLGDIRIPEGGDPLQYREHSESRWSPGSCSVCAEDFVESENVRILPCRHIYHKQCIDPWLLNFAGTCPLW